MNRLNKLSPFFIRATKKGVLWALAWTLLVLGCELLALFESLAWLSWAVRALLLAGLLLMGLFFVDYVWLMRAYQQMAHMHVSRALDNNLPVYETSKVNVFVYHRQPEKLAKVCFCLIDYCPNNTKASGLPAYFLGQKLQANQDGIAQGLSITYQLYADERGAGVFGGVDWLLSTPLGLLSKYYHTPTSQVAGVKDIRILANFRAVVQGNLLAMRRHSVAGGIVRRRRKGQGQDFHQIRSYTQGDSIRHIDWKATARHQRLMSKEYQDEADQEILFLLDCGQQMRHLRFVDDTQLLRADETLSADKVSHLDMALNAMLLLAEVANRQADATGFISFGAIKDKTAPPKKGAKVISYLLNQSFDLQASMKVADYMAVARQALSMQRRRSLLLMITNIRSNHTEEVVAALQLLTQKHRVILVNLYESDLAQYLQQPPQLFDDALTYQSIRAYLDNQQQTNIRLAQQTGALVIGSTPEQLPQKLLDGYWSVRRWGVV